MDRPQITHYADPHTLKRIEDLEAELAKTRKALDDCWQAIIDCGNQELPEVETLDFMAELAEKEETDNE